MRAHLAFVVHENVLIERARLLEGFRLIAPVHVRPERLQLVGNVEILVVFAGHADVLQLGHDVAVDEGHFVAREKRRARLFEIVVNTFEFVRNFSGFDLIVVSIFGLFHEVIEFAEQRAQLQRLLSVAGGRFEVRMEFDVDVRAHVFGLFQRGHVHHGKALADLSVDVAIVRENHLRGFVVRLVEHDHGRIGIVGFLELLLGILHVDGIDLTRESEGDASDH